MLVGKTGPRPLLQAIRHQRADDRARQIRPPRGAAERRRSDDFRPRGRRDRGLPQAAGIAVEIVPGITAAQGAASRLCMSLTHRNAARRVQYVTGHGENGALPADIDYASLADPRATTIVYMPKKTLGELVTKAVAAGLDPATPALAISQATRPDETTITAPIGELAKTAMPDGPTIVMIGSVCAALGLPAKRDLRSHAPSRATRRSERG